jgi:dipeptidyl aminopeptidase/acylaminoacyl peptidase
MAGTCPVLPKQDKQGQGALDEGNFLCSHLPCHCVPGELRLSAPAILDDKVHPSLFPLGKGSWGKLHFIRLPGEIGRCFMETEKIVFESEGQKLSGILHLPDAKNPPCVIASHGLLSSKDSEKYIALGERISKEGIAMLRFDFRGIGESEGGEEDNTISKKVVDLNAGIDFIRSYPGLRSRIGLMGSSLGGFLSLIKASGNKEIKAVVTWAAPIHLDDLGSKRQDEDYPLPPDAFFQDLPRHRLVPLLPKVSHCLVIHGEEDELVSLDQALGIFTHLGVPKELNVIGGADHRLTNPSHRQRAIDLSVDWFKKYL